MAEGMSSASICYQERVLTMSVETDRAMHHVWFCSCEPWRSHRIHSCLFQEIGPRSLQSGMLLAQNNKVCAEDGAQNK